MGTRETLKTQMLNSSPQQLCYRFQLWFQYILPPWSVLFLTKEMFKGLFCREHSVGRQRLRVWGVDHCQSIHLQWSPGYHGSDENIVSVLSF